MTEFKGNLMNLVFGLLLVVQASIASYGLTHVRELAATTHARLAAVADATR